MSVHTYRFRLDTPSVSEEQLAADVGVSVSISDSAGGVIIDVDCDDSRAADLMDAMAFRGYEFVVGDPSSAAVVQFRAENDLLSPDDHKILRQLIHFIEEGPGEGFASGAYREVTGTAFPTTIVWWESAAKLKKIVERLITWAAAKATVDKWKIYDSADGSTVLWTVTDTISYNGVFETNRTRSIASGDA
jgi:hypothetical protein